MTFHKGLHTHRTLEIVQVQPTAGARFCGAFAEPSDGLEPSTPLLTMEVPNRHSRTRVVTRGTHSPANCAVRRTGDASLDVARVVSDVSVLCPRADADRGNALMRRARASARRSSCRRHGRIDFGRLLRERGAE
jgi:hypothetical protein